MKTRIISIAFLLSKPVLAQVPAPVQEQACLTDIQKKQITAIIQELNSIHSAKAELKIKDDIVIIRDWDDRVYINGGSKKPIQATLKLGDTINRDMEMTLPIKVYYREKPPDPMFRLRIRAQAGILVPELIHTLQGKNDPFWDAGIGWDFFHLNAVNIAAYTGIRSVGAGIGLDLTKNFGPYLGYSLKYDGFQSSLLTGIYFSFN